jgi:two-component system, LytTR family, sensor histidine kinase AlgZ
MSPPGATERNDRAAADTFIPNFCDPRMVFAVVLIGALLALVFALARLGDARFLTDLARISVFVQWVGLTSAALLCYGRSHLENRSVGVVSTAVFALLLANTAVVSEATYWLGRRLGAQGLDTSLFPVAHLEFVVRNVAICAIVSALLLRYLFVSHEWRRHVRAEARSRIHALQARIRPHFLFNSLNTIAALTRSDPVRAEEAVEDLADLFRATLRDSDTLLRIKDELELTRIYQRIEMLRLGARLEVKWDVAALPMRALIPGLTVQPLLENAIYHGIEPLGAGGRVRVCGYASDGQITISVTNPVAPERAGRERTGNQVAVENIRQRLEIAYGDEGTLEVRRSADEYEVAIRFPYAE